MPRAISSTTRTSRARRPISHLRFGPRPIHAPYLIESANFVACHQFQFLQRQDILRLAGTARPFCSTAPMAPEDGVGSVCRVLCSRGSLTRSSGFS